MSEEENEEPEPKNLESINFSNRKERVKSPHSKLALAQLGVREEKLYEITKEKYLEMHPELNEASSEIQDKRYEHYNKRREDKIKKAKKLRNEMIEDEKKEKVKENEYNNSDNDNKKKKNDFESTIIKREMEKIEIMKKQQIGEIKNIIDNAYKTQEIKFKII